MGHAVCPLELGHLFMLKGQPGDQTLSTLVFTLDLSPQAMPKDSATAQTSSKNNRTTPYSRQQHPEGTRAATSSVQPVDEPVIVQSLSQNCARHVVG